MKNWKHFSLLLLFVTAGACLAPLTITFAGNSLAKFAGLRMVNSLSLDGNTTKRPSLDKHLVTAGRRNGVDPLLMLALVYQESRFNPHAKSPKGAYGYAQLMPATARAMGVKNIKDPGQNVNGGAKYLRKMLNKFGGKVTLALAAYNAGPGRVRNGQVPRINETQKYVRNISEHYSRLRAGNARRK